MICLLLISYSSGHRDGREALCLISDGRGSMQSEKANKIDVHEEVKPSDQNKDHRDMTQTTLQCNRNDTTTLLEEEKNERKPSKMSRLISELFHCLFPMTALSKQLQDDGVVHDKANVKHESPRKVSTSDAVKNHPTEKLIPLQERPMNEDEKGNAYITLGSRKTNPSVQIGKNERTLNYDLDKLADGYAGEVYAVR